MADATLPAPAPTTELADDLASLVISTYLSLPNSHKPSIRSNGVREWTPLAGIALSRPTTGLLPPELLLISLGAGSKVLPTSKKSKCGDVVNDLHAEVLAGRGARRWLLDELDRCEVDGGQGWLERAETGKARWRLGESVEMLMYVSTLPCGDASMVHLSKLQEANDPEMAALKSTSSATEFIAGELARGRDGYLNIGACRTKPGRADSPPTTSMSCSDKLASWTLLGMQGALLATLLEPIYISHLVVGEIKGCVASLGGQGWEQIVQDEVHRAIGGRVAQGVGNEPPPPPYSPHPPSIYLTSVPFAYSKLHLSEAHPDASITATTTAISYIASLKPERITQTGVSLAGSAVKRDPLGHLPLAEKARSRLCKLQLMRLVLDRLEKIGEVGEGNISYHELKQSAVDYQTAKRALRGKETSVFRAWVGAGEEWEQFDGEGLRTQSRTLEQ